jgi:pimeloyl-ACP methyl ester carboxylesterase
MEVNPAGSKVQTTAATRERYVTRSVTSKDGTTIGYRQLGDGPGIVLLHGSMSTGYYHLQLAEALADAFTIYLPDRRGFGLSGPFNKDDGIQKDVEDLDALLSKTGAHNVFGVSASAIIALKAALSLPVIHKLAIYEPPLFTNSAAPTAMMKRFDAEMAQGKVAAALTTAMKGAPLMSDVFSAMPRWLIEFMTNRMLAFEPKRGSGEYASFRELAPTLHHDGWVISEMSGQQESLRAVQADILLLGGSKSTAFLKAGLDSVAKVLPQARRIEFPGLNHSSTWNTEMRGKPERVAQELRRFFA